MHTIERDSEGEAGGFMMKTIYIVLTDTGTLLSKAIGVYTRKDLNHASIAFDKELTEMYSFGRKQRYNPFIGGFVNENATTGIFRNANCAIYKLDVTEEMYEKMRERVLAFERKKELYKYNFIGLFAVALNVELKRKHAYFCSQFVATIMNEADVKLFSVSPNLVKPEHFSETASFQTVYEGSLQTYLQFVRKEDYLIPNEIGFWQSVRARIPV